MKLAAEFSLPGAPVNFGHFGHSHSGCVRFAVGPGFASRAVIETGNDVDLMKLSSRDWPNSASCRL